MSYTAVVDPAGLGTITNFNGGASFPAGLYVVSYVQGCVDQGAGGGTPAQLCAGPCFITDSVSNTVPLAPNGIGAFGVYYQGNNFQSLIGSRADNQINFSWGSAGPGLGINPTSAYSVRWQAFVASLYGETYTFSCTSNGGTRCRVGLDGQALTTLWDTFGVGGQQTNSGSIALTAGTIAGGPYTRIILEYYNDGSGNSDVALYWQSAHQAYELIPAGPVGQGMFIGLFYEQSDVPLYWDNYSRTYCHAGGTIGVELAFVTANTAQGSPALTYQLTGPIPDSMTFTATQVTCSARYTTLTWTTSTAVSASIDGIGPVATSGSMNIYWPAAPTTYTLRATDACGGVTVATATATFASNLLLLPGTSSAPAYFNNGASYAPGVYLITACGGAIQWNRQSYGVNANDRAFYTSQAFKVVDAAGVVLDVPGNYCGYSTLAACDVGNAGLTQIYNHQGGPIGVYLNLDSYFGVVSAAELPGFSIVGPAPTASMAANTAPVLAGSSVALTWAVLGNYDSITIDQGIGSVGAAGSLNVSPTATTRYTITLTYRGLTVTTFADVLVGTPSIPVATVAGACFGTVNIGWTAPAFTTETIIEQSPSGGGVGFTVIDSVAPPTLSIAVSGVTATPYYYRLRNTDGSNYSGYTEEFVAGAFVPPAAANLAVSSPLGVPILKWTAADPTAMTYQILRGSGAGGESFLTIVLVRPGTVVTYRDATATNGVPAFYKVVGVNGCGSGAASNEVSTMPGTSDNPYQ